MTCAALDQFASIPIHVAGRALVAAGIRSLQTDDNSGLTSVWTALERRLLESGKLVQRIALDAVELTASAIWLDYSQSMSSWRRLPAIAVLAIALSAGLSLWLDFPALTQPHQVHAVTHPDTAAARPQTGAATIPRINLDAIASGNRAAAERERTSNGT